MDFFRRNRRRLLALAAAGAAGAAAAYYVYTRWDEIRAALLDTAGAQGAGEAEAELCAEVERDLAHHFENIQRVTDSTTLPGMLGEMEAHLNRKADTDHLLQLLREGRDGLGFAATPAGQLATWEELKLLSFTRTLAATWLVPVVDLLLRLQLNMLGRHIFLENNLMEPRPAQAWPLQPVASPQPVRVSNRAQQMFLEYAHFIPERGTDVVVEHMRTAVAKVIGGIDLKERLDTPAVLQIFSDAYRDFESAIAVRGWANLLFPRDEEADAYFARYHEAAPDYTALTAETSLQRDEEVVKTLMREARLIVESSKFDAALKAAVQEAARQVVQHVSGGLEQLGPGPWPLAKVTPRVSAALVVVLKGKDEQNEAWQHTLQQIAALPEVEMLCATVYSCGPPL